MNIFDAHISGSLSVSSSAEISGNLTVLGTINATVSGTSTNALTASEAPKYTLTSSFNQFTSSYTTGSFTGSFKGDGTNLYNIPASGVTGLNLNKIISGSVSASLSPNRGFEVNTDATFTGSVNITGSIYLNGNPIGTGKLDETTFNSYTSSINTYTGNTSSTIATLSTTSSVNTLSSSIATTDDNQNTRLGLLETSTGSLNSFTSSTLIRVGAIETSTGSLNTFTSSASGRLTSLESASSSIRGDFNSYTSSNDSTNSTQSGRLTSIESATSSLNTFTSSIDTTIKNKLNTETVISGSVQVLITGTTGYSTFSSSVSTSIGSLSSSVATTTNDLSSSIGSLSSSVATTNSGLSSSIGSLSSSVATTTSGLSSSIGSLSSSIATTNSNQDGKLTSLETYTGSNNTVIGTLQTSTGSLNSYTSSNTTNINAIHTATSSLNTFTSSFNTAIGLSSADVTIKGNLTISGTTTTINSTTVAIGDNIIQLNGTGATNAGLVVRDATAPNTLSGSLLWDTTNDKWIAGTLGSEDDIILKTASQTLTNKTINASQLVDASVTNAKLQYSSLTIAGTSVSLNGSISAATILSSTGVWSGSAQLPSGVVSSSLQTIANLPAGTVSGSSQVLSGTGIWSGSAQLPSGVVSGSAQTIANLPSGTVSGSAQVTGLSNAQLTNSSFYVGTTSISLGRASASQTLTGISIDGNAATVTNFSGTHTGASSGTNTGDETLARVNALAITTVGTITSGIWNGTTIAIANGGTGGTTASGARTNLGLAIGSDVLAYRTFGTAAASNTGDFAAYNATTYVGTTAIALNRASASQTLTGVSVDGSSSLVTQTLTGTNEANLIYAPIADNDFFRLRVGGTATNSGWVELATADDGNEPIYVRQYTGTFTTLARTATLLDGSGNTSFPGTVTATSFSGNATNVSGTVAIANGGTGGTTAAAARTNLGLVIGTDVLAYRTFGTAAASATGDFAAYNATHYVGTTAIAANRASASQTLTGVSIDGNAATVTNATFYRQFTVRDDRSDGNDYSLANRPTGLYAITSTGTNGPGSTYSSLIHVANGTDVAFQIAGGYTSDNMYFRGTSALQSGTGYSAWRTVIHSGNIGSQSVSYASTAGSATTAGNISAYTINQNVGTGNSPTFVDLYARSHFMQRNANTTHGISWYSSGYTAWCQYMAAVNVASTGPTGNITSPAAGNFVTSWALRSFIENVSGYGWTWEAGSSTGQPSIVAEMSSATGNFYTKGSITVGGIFTENSSIRYKTNIETIKYGLDKILQMRGVTYTRKDSGNIEAGVIAEEMYDVTPLVVLKNKDGEVDSVSYGRINAYLIEAVKELKQEINEQNLIITELKGKLGL